MSVIFIALPVALGLAGLAVAAFVSSVRSGQFDDLQTPPLRMLFDGSESRQAEKSSSHIGVAGGTAKTHLPSD